MYKQVFILVFLSFTSALQADTLELYPGHPAMAVSSIEPFEVTFRYRRPENPDPNTGTRVTWRLEKNDAVLQTTLITHAGDQEYLDINRFDADTLAHISTDIPTQLEDGSLADIHLDIKGNLVQGTITPRGEGDIQSIKATLPGPVMGGGWDLIPATLNLELNTTIRWPMFNILSEQLEWKEGTVIRQETLDTVLGPQKTWVIEASDGSACYWVNHQPPYVYKRLFFLEGQPFIVWELAQD